MKQILITGGAGFIGSHLADTLLSAGHRVRALDNLSPQVHGEGDSPPGYLSADVELIVGDVRDRETLDRALQGAEVVFHLAAAVGVGQSMYRIEHYTDVNNRGTAVLLEALSQRPVERLVVASSMSVYGEGLYHDRRGQPVELAERTRAQLEAGDWETRGPEGEPLTPVPTPERKRPSLASVYALSKYDQERMCLMVGAAYGIATTALRFFNVFGTRQALSNPYTGVLAIFASRILNGKPPTVFEDGRQRRDFVSVSDVARACQLAMHRSESAGEVLNIGSGRSYAIEDIARRLARVLEREDLEPEITGKYRVGDIRHCFADIGRAREVLGFEPRVALEDGLAELAAWLARQVATDRVEQAQSELAARGLTV